MSEFISLKVTGLKELIASFVKWPREIRRMAVGAGRESRDVILRTEGLKSYPPKKGQYAAPYYPHYKRGIGTQTSPGHNLMNSENMGKKWYSKEAAGYGIEIGNTASYAKWAHGKEQSRMMAGFGWRQLLKVAQEKTQEIQSIWQRWVNDTLRRIGLR